MENNYFLGIDIGTNSVGYAVTNDEYKLEKYNGKAMWGVQIFDEATTSAERRGFRTSRRRLHRRKQRSDLIREMFAMEISKKDEHFFKRLDESSLYMEDKNDILSSSDTLFNDSGFKDFDYHKKYPTIHHLIMELIDNKEPHDVRLVYLAVSYLISHRGHFLFDMDNDNIDNILSFDSIYQAFVKCFDVEPWEIVDIISLQNVLKNDLGIKRMQEELQKVLYPTIKLDKQQKEILKAMSGGQFSLAVLFDNDDYESLEANKLSFAKADIDDVIEDVMHDIGEDCELLLALKAIYNWSLTMHMMNGTEDKYISRSKITIYENHKKDLALLKKFVKKYIHEKYNEVFRTIDSKINNYTAYSGNVKSVLYGDKNDLKRTKQEDFLKYLKSIFKNVTPDKGDEESFNNMISRIDNGDFIPKQKTTDNRIIPSQLYFYELKSILNNAENYLEFLKETDISGLTTAEKILSVFEFKIPYYVGPLNKYNNKFAWLERKPGKIYPWNFNEMVDLEKSEESFIRRMTSKCTYLAGEDVIPKASLLYSKFMVLNEINKIKVNDKPISVNLKQNLYTDLFVNSKKTITKKEISKWFKTQGIIANDISGIDDKIKSSLSSHHKFKRLLISGKITENDAEKIISRATITTDKRRLRIWLKENFHTLNDSKEDLSYIANMNFSEYGRLSYKLLSEIEAPNPETGEMMTIIRMMWETNCNLMELLSARYLFGEIIDRLNKEYYCLNPLLLEDMMKEMYVPASAKRAIYRTIDVLKEIIHIKKGNAPSKIFIEMARGSEDEPSRKASRKDKLLEMYKTLNASDYGDIINKLNDEIDDSLKSKKLFLYYLQLGRCMYTGKPISIEALSDNNRYDIDHIYPQARIKDDSFDNMVLVEKEANGAKSDNYPLPSDIQLKMNGFWQILSSKNLISSEKLYRLTRKTPFKDEELAGFINRQLVETRQSIKALTVILKEYCNDIVYVKAGLVSDFRHAFGLPKNRVINDLHHAKDAYLNIVMGNIYDVKFTRNPLNFIKESGGNSKYTLKLTAKEGQGLLSHDIIRGNKCAWKSDGSSLSTVMSTMRKNNINYVRYSYCRNGKLFNRLLNRAPHKENDLIPIKKGLDTSKYGGYNNTTATYFTLVKHAEKGEAALSIIPVDLMIRDEFERDDLFALNYLAERYNLKNPEFILGRKILKINTMIEMDGFRANIASKSKGGKTLVLSSAVSLIVTEKWDDYIKRLANLIDKAKKNRKPLKIDSLFDRISNEENSELYNLLLNKCNANVYKSQSFIKTTTKKTLEDGIDIFNQVSIEEQVKVLMNIINIFKTGRTTGCDLKSIGGSGQSGVITANSKISSLNCNELYIIDQSSTGLYEKRSENLMIL